MEYKNVMYIQSVNEILKNIDTTKKLVIVTGVTGQDGSLMVDYLLENTDYNIIGGARRLSVENHININNSQNNPRFNLVNFDLSDTHSINTIVKQFQPDYFINFAAQTFVKSSWEFPAQTWEINTTGVLHILEAIRQHCSSCRFYNAGSSEEFGDVIFTPQNEDHPLRPRSPYGASKAGARQLVKTYRESYNLFAIQAWLFNHEGPRRGYEFVTRKITRKIAKMHKKLLKGEIPTDILDLGNLDAKRDWSDAEDCIKAVWLMLNNYSPKEYVVCSGESHSIREFIKIAFDRLEVTGEWRGEGLDEKFYYVDGPYKEIPKDFVLIYINPSNYRPAEVNALQGNSSKIRHDLNWMPQTSFKGLIEKMIDNDIKIS